MARGEGGGVGGDSTVTLWTLIGRQRIQIKDCFGGGADGRRGQEAGQGYRAKRGVCGGARAILLINYTLCKPYTHYYKFLFKIFPTVTLLWLAQEEPQKFIKGT